VKSGCRGRARGTRGFTLIEVLVALSLAGIVLASLVPLLVASVHGVDQARRLTTASGLAQGKLEEIRNTAGVVAGGSDSVDATGRGETYTRTWTVGAGPTATCKTLTVAVAWNERGSHSVSLHSILEQ